MQVLWWLGGVKDFVLLSAAFYVCRGYQKLCWKLTGARIFGTSATRQKSKVWKNSYFKKERKYLQIFSRLTIIHHSETTCNSTYILELNIQLISVLTASSEC